ncbi:MAG: hypothetical protein NT166_22405 [Candidatus Aminicenantes bacterium]|nr:hypothetical protein [Candidatus Aminicenantes bacterium]
MKSENLQKLIKTFATKRRRTKAPKIFYNKPLGVPLCLCALGAIFMIEEI